MASTKQSLLITAGVTLLVAACSDSSSSDSTPNASSITATTVEGADNDRIVVLFDTEVVEAEAETIANWTIQSPVGTSFDMTGATIDYVVATRTATVTLGSGTVGTMANGNNLQTFDSLRASFADIHDLDGDSIDDNRTITAVVGGDDQAPQVLGVFADGVATTATLRFDEASREVLLAELFNGVPGDPGPRFILTDADGIPAVAATGTVTFGGLPTDAETIVIDDGTQVVTFEFDNDASVVETPTLRQVVIGVDANTTAANLDAAVNSGGFTFDISSAVTTNVCDLTHDNAGAAGNIAIVDSATNVTAAGMAGGMNDVPTQVDPGGGGFAWASDGMGVTLDFTPNVPNVATDTIEIYGLRDLAGNQMIPVPLQAPAASSANIPSLSIGTSTLSAIAGEQNDTIVVNFAETMSRAFIGEPSNYSAAPLDLSGADFQFNGTNQVTIDLEGAGADIQFGVSYNLTLVRNAATPLMTAQGVEIPADEIEPIAAIGDNAPVTQVTTAAYVGDAGNPSTAVVFFPEAVEQVGATTLTSFDILGVNPTVIDVRTPRALRLTFPTAPAVSDVVNIQVAGGTDLGGNPPAGVMSVALTSVDATAPTATFTANASSGYGEDFLTITFDEPVEVSTALDADNYAVTEDAAPVSLQGAQFSYDSSNHEVEICTPSSFDFTFGSTVALTMTGVTDLSGNVLAVQPTDATTAGDSAAPGFGGAYVNWIEDVTGQTVDVYFDEDVEEAFAETLGNWAFSGATPIASVELIAPHMARFTTTGQIMAAETLDVTGLLDRAGNAAGALSLNPDE